jgi:two-component system, NtrC family, response regulator AtoC
VTDASILVIAGPRETATALRATLERRGFSLLLAESCREGVGKLALAPFSLVLIALPLSDVRASDAVSALRKADSEVPIFVIGTDADVSCAEEAVALGATEYLEPVNDEPHEFLARIGFALGVRRADRHLRYLHTKDLPAGGWQSIIGQSAALKSVVSVLQQVSARSSRGATPTIFLGGETGTGKGFIAKCIHSNGARKNRPFVEVNCAALPASLIEAELFGHERGSFTDAKTARNGLFEAADGGTLFLDEIGAVPLDLQAKLLTAIEEKRVRRLGARVSVSVDVQIIAATHANLRRMVKEGTFREDLFHRLNVVSVTVPPLRERGDDILLLAESFLQMFCRDYGIRQRRLSPEAKAWMRGYSWPGNVRELRNQIERSVLLGDDEVVSPTLFRSTTETPRAVQVDNEDGGGVHVTLPPDGVSLEVLEREILRQALQQCEGNVSRASRFLSISRQTFIYRMKKYGLSEETKKGATGP